MEPRILTASQIQSANHLPKVAYSEGFRLDFIHRDVILLFLQNFAMFAFRKIPCRVIKEISELVGELNDQECVSGMSRSLSLIASDYLGLSIAECDSQVHEH